MWRLARLTVVVLSADVSAAVTVETVPLGNSGNTDDTRYETPGFGGANDVCRIGAYEVIASQCTDLFNAVAATDAHGLSSRSMWSRTYGYKIQHSGIPGSYPYRVASDRVNRPVNFVLHVEAVAIPDLPLLHWPPSACLAYLPAAAENNRPKRQSVREGA
jgi:hypothetical protein